MQQKLTACTSVHVYMPGTGWIETFIVGSVVKRTMLHYLVCGIGAPILAAYVLESEEFMRLKNAGLLELKEKELSV